MPILCQPAATAGELIPAIGGSVRSADSLHVAAQMLETDPAETLVVIGPETPAGDALTFASTLRLVRPTVGVILARDHVDVNLLTHALRAGVREVVQAGDRAALAAACRRSDEVSRRLIGAATTDNGRSARGEGKVVTVFAAKGGCGKTTLALNLAV